MPRTRSLAWSQLKIGILALAAMVLAVMLILAGVNVGAVEEVYFVGAVVEMVLRIRPDVSEKITDRSVAQIGSVSLLGEGAIDISAANEGTPLADWAYIRSARTPGQIADVAENATETLAQASALIEDIRGGKGTVGKLFTHDELYQQLSMVVRSTDDVVQAIKQGRGPAGSLINNREAARNLERALANLDTVTTNLAAGRGTLGNLLNDDAMARSMTATTENLRAITASLKSGQGTAGKLFTDEALYNRLDSVTQRLDVVLTALNKGEGTAGKLLNDKQLYDNMNGAVTELRGLLAAIQKDPKKYLNVKVTIF